MFYRAVEIKDGESAEPVNFVGVHPIAWSDIASGPPAVGFVEDDTIADLLAACEVARDALNSLPVDALGSANDGELVWPIRDELIHTLSTAIAKTRAE